MDFEVGNVVTGKVSGITKFGAFVALAGGKSGLVHISEIANRFVNDVSEHLSVGQEVRVKIIGIDDSGRINLSIKRAGEEGEPPQRPRPVRRETAQPRGTPAQPRARVPEGEMTFEDKLKRFMQESDGKMSDVNRRSRRKSK